MVGTLLPAKAVLPAKAFLLAMVMLFASCGASGGSDESESAAADATAQLSGDFTTISGSQIDLGSLEGQDTVLWFWAPW